MSVSRAIRASLGAKLALTMLGVLAASSVGVLLVNRWSERRRAEELQHEMNAEVAAHIAGSDRFFEDGVLREDAAKKVFMKAMVVNPSLEIYLLDDQGRVVAFDAPEEAVVRRRVDLGPVREALAAGGEGPVLGDDPRSAAEHKPIGVARVEEEGGEGYVYVVLGGQLYDAVAADSMQRASARTALALTLLCFLAAGAAGLFALRKLVRPLGRLREGMERFQRGERVRLSAGEDEVGALTREFQRLAARLRAHVEALDAKDEQRRAFVAGVSHDLRTPTAAVLGLLESLEEDLARLEPGEARARLASASRQAQRLSRLVDRLFELARLEVAEELPDPEPCSVAELVQDVVRKYEHAPHAGAVRVGASFPTDLPDACADLGLVERALDNLIDNAVRHSPPGGTVRVRVVERARGVEVAVEDEGPGVDPDVLADGRRGGGTTPRAGSAEGLGLGLEITRRIARLHGGALTVGRSPAGGARLAFTLPRAESPPIVPKSDFLVRSP